MHVGSGRRDVDLKYMEPGGDPDVDAAEAKVPDMKGSVSSPASACALM